MNEIEEFKKQLISKNIRGLALDIDETLADSNLHWFRQMFKFHNPPGMVLNEILEKHRFVEEIPGWTTKEAFDHMEILMHSEEFNEDIPLIENSNLAAMKIHQNIPILAYITARPETVINSTRRWLAKHNFPEAKIITRASDIKASTTDVLDRNIWKAKVLSDLFPHIQGIVDDNKILAYELKKLNYQGTHYLYGIESDEFDGENHVVVCPTWDSVLQEFKLM
jgi:hypothetical protein